MQVVLQPPFRLYDHPRKNRSHEWCEGSKFSMREAIAKRISRAFRRTKIVRDGFAQSLSDGTALSAEARARMQLYLQRLDLEQAARQGALELLGVRSSLTKEPRWKPW